MNTDAAAAGERASSHWGADILASLVVFLVALQLCMGVAVAFRAFSDEVDTGSSQKMPQNQ